MSTPTSNPTPSLSHPPTYRNPESIKTHLPPKSLSAGRANLPPQAPLTNHPHMPRSYQIHRLWERACALFTQIFTECVLHETGFEALGLREGTKHSSCPRKGGSQAKQSSKCQAISATGSLGKMRGAAAGRGGHGAGSPGSLSEGGLLERELAKSDLWCVGTRCSRRS